MRRVSYGVVPKAETSAAETVLTKVGLLVEIRVDSTAALTAGDWAQKLAVPKVAQRVLCSVAWRVARMDGTWVARKVDSMADRTAAKMAATTVAQMAEPLAK